METPSFTKYPVLPIRGTVFFPGITIPLKVGRSRSLAAMKAVKENPWVIVVAQRDQSAGTGDPKIADLYRVGTLAKIETIRGADDTGYTIVARGVARFRIDEYIDAKPYLEAEGLLWKDDNDVDAKTNEALLRSLKTTAGEILGWFREIPNLSLIW
ncbi:MAG: hypothetical protein EOP11_08095 [Proteobacteria bacterium]|nr:MAG: hypothetical protein EOP11_08095 [Pseudomonadota bacterium]